MTRRSLRVLLVVAASAALLASACASGGTAKPLPTTNPSASRDAFGSSGKPPSGGAGASSSAAAAAGGSPASAGGSCPTSAPPPMGAGDTRTVTIATPKGNIVFKLEGKLGPRAAANFVALAQCGYYAGVIFHRLVPGFVIQGGDGQFGRVPNVDEARAGQGGPGYEFGDDPVKVPYARGTVAMANSGADTNGSQFFIVLADAGLPPAYSVFGHVTAGMDVVDAIGAMPNSGNATGNRALDPVAMTSVTVTTP